MKEVPAMSRRLLALLLVLVLPVSAGANYTESRPLRTGVLYLGMAPGVNFGGHSLPRDTYMDLFHAGYIFPNGLDVSFALSGRNWFPGENEWSITMNRLAVGWRPFLRDPLPMIQPYVLGGLGLGGVGRYMCEAESDCDPSRNECRTVCGRADWAFDLFAGAGFDVSMRLFDVAGQQILFYVGAQGRYEWLPGHDTSMGVFTLPVGLRLL
jgi:hypothetical protein